VLPISELKITVKRPNKQYPKQVVTIGEHIRKRRLDLKLYQRELGDIIGICSTEICRWENGGLIQEQFFPKIIEFLNYDPFHK